MADKRILSASRALSVLGDAKASQERSTEALRIGFLVAADAPRSWLERCKHLFVPQQESAHIEVMLVSNHAAQDLSLCDAVVALGNTPDLQAQIVQLLAWGIEIAHVHTPSPTSANSHAMRLTHIEMSEGSSLDSELARWIAHTLDKRIACAVNFPFCRREVQKHLIQAAGLSGIGIALLPQISDADIVLLGTAQLKLAFDLAATTGRKLQGIQMGDVAVVCATSLIYRQLARMLTKRAALIAPFIKVLIAYVGTITTGVGIVVLHSDRFAEAWEKLNIGGLSAVSSIAEQVLEHTPLGNFVSLPEWMPRNK